MTDSTDPNERLAQRLGIPPAVLAARFKELGLRVVDVNEVTNTEQETRHVEWMRRLRNGTLSERKIVGQP
jgi:hypothetical protein